MPLSIVAREEWALIPSIPYHDTARSFTRVFVQNANLGPCQDREDCQCTVRLLHFTHVNRHHHQDIRFNFVVGEDGNVYECRGWHIIPLLPKKFYKFRKSSFLIGFLGNYKSESIPEKIDDATSDLIQYGVRKGRISVDYHYYDISQVSKHHPVTNLK